MFKRTLGKWDWIVVSEGEKLKATIIVRNENDNGILDGEPLEPTIGDYKLVTNAPEMHDLLYEVVDVIDEALAQGVITSDIHKICRKASALLAEINVERTNPPASRSVLQEGRQQ